MSYHTKFICIYVLCGVFFEYTTISYCKKELYFSLERPHLLYKDDSVVTNLVIKSQRVSRHDPIHYVNISFNLKKVVNNEYKNSFYLYQLLSNVYKRSFVELHFGVCEIFKTENVFSATLIPAFYREPPSKRVSPLFECPVKPGYYHFGLMKIHSQYIPKSFPFNEGRAFYNLTLKNKLLVNAYVDFQLLTTN